MLSANYTLVSSTITVQQNMVTDKRAMWGQSPYSANVSLSFREPTLGTNVTLGFNKYGRRIVQVGLVGSFGAGAIDPHVYEEPRDVLDITLQQTLFQSLDLKLSARDVLNQNLKWTQLGQTISSSNRGTTVSFSVGYRFH